MTGQPPPGPDAPLLALLRDAVAAALRLVQGEVALARAEAAQTLARARRGALMLAVALGAGLIGLNLLAQAAVAGLVAAGLPPPWALLATAAAALCLALGLARAGAARLAALSRLPGLPLRRLRDGAAGMFRQEDQDV